MHVDKRKLCALSLCFICVSPVQTLPDGKEASKYLLWWYLEDQIKVG